MTAFCACNRVERYTEAVPNGGGAIIDRWRCVDCGCHYERQAPVRAELAQLRSALATVRATRWQIALFALLLVNMGLGLARLRQERLCFSRGDVETIADGIARGMRRAGP
jgi:hypothetical protein